MIHVAVNFLRLKIEVSTVRLPGIRCHILGLSLIIFHDCLRLTNIACASVLRALHEDVLLDHVSVRQVSELLALAALLELLGDDAEALVPIERRVGDLCLEGEVRDCCHVKILDLQQLRYRLHSILECEHGVRSNISESSRQHCLVRRQVCLELVAELQSLVQLDLGLYFSGDRLLRKDIGEIARELVRIDLLDLTAREFNQARKTLNVGISAGNGDKIDHDSTLLSKLANFVIELCRGLITTVLAVG